MIPRRLCFVGLLLLTLVCTVHSSVMLTANKKDLVGLARKFVSESLADKIAEFIVELNGQMPKKNSEESLKDHQYTKDTSYATYRVNNNEGIQKHKNHDTPQNRKQKQIQTKEYNKHGPLPAKHRGSQYWEDEKNEISNKRYTINNYKKYLKTHDKNRLEKLRHIAKTNDNEPKKTQNQIPERRDFQKIYHPGKTEIKPNARESQKLEQKLQEHKDYKRNSVLAPFLTTRKPKMESSMLDEDKSESNDKLLSYPKLKHPTHIEQETSSDSKSEELNATKPKNEKEAATSKALAINRRSQSIYRQQQF